MGFPEVEPTREPEFPNVHAYEYGLVPPETLEVKATLRVRKNPDVGKKTFDYYYANEVEAK